MRRTCVILRLLVLVLGLSRLGFSTVHNVSTAGQLTTALSTAVAGDEIIVANGTYTGTFNITTNSGASGNPITLRAANLHGAIIDGTALTQDGNLTYNCGFNITKSWWIIHGFVLKEHQIAINISEVGAASNNLEIRHNLIHDFRHVAVRVGSSNNYIHHNVMGISDAVTLFSTSPFVVYGMSLTTDNRVIDNIIYSQSNDGYLVPTGGSAGGGVWGSGDNNAWLVQGNLFMDLNRTTGSRFFSLQHVQPSTNNVTRDNISIHAPGGSFGVGENEDDGVVTNNLIYGGFINAIGAKGNDPGRNDFLHNSIFLTQFSFNGFYISTAPDQSGGPAVVSKASIVKDNLFYSTLANADTGMFLEHYLFDVFFGWSQAIAESNYNLFWRPGTDSGATAWNLGVTYGANDIHSTEPTFVDAATGDFTLAGGSPGKGSASDSTDRGAVFNSYLKKEWFQNAFALPTQETATGGGTSLSFTTSAANQYQVFSYTPDTGYYVGTENFSVEGQTIPRNFALIDDWYLGAPPRRWIYLGTHSTDGTLNVSWQHTNAASKIFIRQMPTVQEAYAWIVPATAPTLNFFALPISISSGESSTLTWSSADTTSCTASGGWSGSKALSGSEVVSPTQNTTYTLSCTGAGGQISVDAPVTVTATVPVVEAQFGTKTIDGNTSDWAGISSYPITALGYGVNPSSPADLTSTLKAAWDTTYLYILVEVTDDQYDISGGANIFDNDGIEIMVDGLHDRSVTFGSDDHQIFVRADGLTQAAGHTPADGKVIASTAGTTNYIVETAIRWDFIAGNTAQANQLYGFTMDVNDRDNETRESQMFWKYAGATHYSNTSQYGDLKLLAAPPGVSIPVLRIQGRRR